MNDSDELRDGELYAGIISAKRYRILRKLGAGGMGEVFLAEDAALERKVALKILPAEVADDSDRVRRFVQEAKAASVLNHPNILTIYEIGQAENSRFIATEFIEGKTLRERLNKDAFGVRETLDIAVHIASALQAAHRAGIVHRDIKPENIMLREADGSVKVLDFGLAKLSEPEAATTGSEDETRAQLKTQAGMILGTAAYMSPEQARGKKIDERTDIFSFGVVLYEMLTGFNPFKGESVADVLAAVLHREPEQISVLKPEIPDELSQIVAKALCKDCEERYSSTQILLADLKKLQKRLEFEVEFFREREKGRTEEGEKVTEIQPSPQLPVSASSYLNSVAVLPFTHLSNDPDNDYFCDGLAEELLNALSRIDDLKVAARTSAFSFKNKNVEVSEIGRALNVKTILEGSVRKSGNRLRIIVQLVNAADGFHLWSERYDRQMRDIFDVQDEITLAVVDALKVKLFGKERSA
ncbi:MAG TPA: protein kinase, partial [Pyrinomonadaceae bacterium]|nr:protein kinase [Pyrinomonadaceae bacterium]